MNKHDTCHRSELRKIYYGLSIKPAEKLFLLYLLEHMGPLGHVIPRNKTIVSDLKVSLTYVKKMLSSLTALKLISIVGTFHKKNMRYIILNDPKTLQPVRLKTYSGKIIVSNSDPSVKDTIVTFTDNVKVTPVTFNDRIKSPGCPVKVTPVTFTPLEGTRQQELDTTTAVKVTPVTFTDDADVEAYKSFKSKLTHKHHVENFTMTTYRDLCGLGLKSDDLEDVMAEMNSNPSVKHFGYVKSQIRKFGVCAFKGTAESIEIDETYKPTPVKGSGGKVELCLAVQDETHLAKIKETVKESIPGHSFKMWIEPITFKNGKLFCPNKFIAEKVMNQYSEVIQQAM